MTHKEWVDNEYKLWVEALQESTVHNFKEHPQVKRMLGEVDRAIFFTDHKLVDILEKHNEILIKIEYLGRNFGRNYLPGSCIRMVYYALKILELNPKSICEIGAGVGQFYAVLRVLGYKGDYYIYDLPEVHKFQRKYLEEVAKQTGLRLSLITTGEHEMCISFYALGEFDDKTKEWYMWNVIKDCPKGFIIWNSHSGASEFDYIPFKTWHSNLKVEPEYPLTGEGNLQITW